MSQASFEEELSLVPLDAVRPLAEPEPARGWAASRLSEACDVLGSAARLLRPPEAERQLHRGPGWFDSSWDLRRGCDVREGWPGDAGLRDWIETWLYGEAVGGASFSAT